MSQPKLGKRRSDPSLLAKVPHLHNYRLLGVEIPTPPAACNWLTAAKAQSADPLPMDLNDTLGICVVAAMEHCRRIWTANTGTMLQASTEELLSVYSAISGYDPSKTDSNGDNETDTGCDMITALNYWRDTGFCGHKIAGYVRVDQSTPINFQRAISIFGVLFMGIDIPDPLTTGDLLAAPWDDGKDASAPPDDANGHGVMSCQYYTDPTTGLWIPTATWGNASKPATVGFFQRNSPGECFIPLSPDWLITAKAVAPSGWNWDQLNFDMKAMAA